MTSPSSSPTEPHIIMRHYVEVLTAFTLLFVIQIGLIPFDILEGGGERGSTEFFGTSTSSFTIPDIVSNLFLYLPVGLFVHWTLWRRIRSRVTAALVAVAVATTLSGGIEWAQTYSPARVSSMIDLVCNVIGACIGVAISGLARWIVPRIIGAALQEFRRRPEVSLVKAYTGLLVFMAVIPLSLSFDLGLVRRSLRTVTLVPFGAVARYHRQADDALAQSDTRPHALAKWRELKHWSRWAAECAAFAVFAWLLQPVLRGDYGFGRCGTILLTGWLGAMLAVGLSLCQLPILTRDVDVTDVLFRMLGICAGLGAVWFKVPAADKLKLDAPARRPHRRARIACAAATAYIVYIGAIPLTVDWNSARFFHVVARPEFSPFVGYFATRFDLMIDDVMEKFVAYAVFGALLAGCWLRSHTLRARLLSSAGVAAALSGFLELVQMYIPVRVTSLTDPILAASGCAAGVLAREHLVRFYRRAMSWPTADTASPPRDRSGGADMKLTDELIGTLIDPAPGTPSEGAGSPRLPHPQESS